MNIGWGDVTWKEPWKDDWKIFFWTMCDPKPSLGMTGTYFQATYAESKLFGQNWWSTKIFSWAASPRRIEIQPCPSEQGFCVGSGHGISWMSIPHFTRKAHSARWKVPPCCESVCCQDQRFLPLLHRCVMAVASPVVVLLVDLQLRQQSIPLSFEVPCFAAPSKETEREREREILDEQLDEFKNLLISAWWTFSMGWNGFHEVKSPDPQTHW